MERESPVSRLRDRGAVAMSARCQAENFGKTHKTTILSFGIATRCQGFLACLGLVFALGPLW